MAEPRLPASGQLITIETLAAFFEQALGAERSRELIVECAARENISDASLTREQALIILEKLASSTGLVAVVARFAKARLLLQKTA